jgi:hypothetical protein
MGLQKGLSFFLIQLNQKYLILDLGILRESLR